MSQGVCPLLFIQSVVLAHNPGGRRVSFFMSNPKLSEWRSYSETWWSHRTPENDHSTSFMTSLNIQPTSQWWGTVEGALWFGLLQALNHVVENKMNSRVDQSVLRDKDSWLSMRRSFVVLGWCSRRKKVKHWIKYTNFTSSTVNVQL